MGQEVNQNKLGRQHSNLNDLEKDLLASMTEARDALLEGEKLQKKFTMRRVELQLNPHKLDAEAVKALREQYHASQKVFAQLIGVSVSALRNWEQGTQEPPPWASRLFEVMKNHPKPWIDKLNESASVVEPNGDLCEQ